MERKHSISPARKSEEKSIPVVEDQPTNNHVILDEDGDERKMSSFRAYVRLWSYSSPLDIFLRVVAGVAALSGGSAYPLMTIVFGNLINNFNDAAMGSLSPATFRKSVNDNTVLFVYLFIGKFALLYIANFLFCFTATRIARRIRLKYLAKVLYQPISYFDRHTPGSIAASLSADTNMIEVGLADKVASLGQGIGMVITAFGIGFAKSWKMTLVIGTTIPWVLLVTGSLGSLQSELENKKRDLFSQASSIAEEAISSIANITALGALEKIVEKFAKPVRTASRCTIRIGPVTATIYGNMFFTMQCGYSLALFYGVKLVSNHEIKNGGTLITVLFCMLMSTSAMGIIAPSIPTFIKAAAAAQEVLRVVEQKNPEDEVRNMGENPLPESVEGNLQLQHITFAYPQRPDIKVLDKLSLDILPGKTTAIVGQSGSGKSTIIGLLERWYDPDEGTVRFDGEDIKELDRHWLRNQISLVQQEPILFNTTILQNVLNGLRGNVIQNLGSPEKRDLVMNACIMANAHDFIQSLPYGYDTNVGERAHLLSGGQKQRIAIARSLISNPKILLLDEPTSALDSESENAVQIALEKASKGRTTLMISHKLATVRTADRILVMDKGAIVEEGTHSSLLARGGLYCRLFHAQTTGCKIEAGERVTNIEGVHTPTSKKHLLHTEASTIEKPSDLTLTLDSVEIARKHSLISGIAWIVLGARSTWLSFFGGTVGSIVAGACIPIQSYLFSKLVTVFQLHGTNLVDRGTFWALMFFILAIINLAFYAILWFLFSITASIVTRKHRSGYLRDILNQDIHFFELPGHSSGALSALMGADGDDIESTFTMNIGLLMVFFVDIVSCCILAISVGWKLGLVGVFGCYPIMFFAGYVRMRMETTAQDRCASSFLESSRYSSEAVEEIRTVSAFTMEGKVLEGYSARLKSAVVTIVKRNLGLMALFGLSDSIDLLAIALVFWYGGKLVSTGFMSVQSYFIVYMCIIFGGQGAGFIFGFSSSITRAQGAANRIHHMSSLKPKINSTTGLRPSETPIMNNEVIKFNDVHFTYPSRPDVEVFQGLSFTICPGETICFVGPSGCGKSTIISLLERFYDITSGSLNIYNTPIEKFDIKSLRKTLSLVSQETNLFQGTIRENICLGIPPSMPISEERIIEVSKQANIHDFIGSLPEGYSTPCGPRGRLLSGGQRQRIAIARALLRDPKVLLLDEATSALDNESQGLIVDALGKVGEGKTVVCVSHQEEIMRMVDRIFVIEHGGVVEEGGYEELMRRRGRFWEMRDELIWEG